MAFEKTARKVMVHPNNLFSSLTTEVRPHTSFSSVDRVSDAAYSALDQVSHVDHIDLSSPLDLVSRTSRRFAMDSS